MLPLSLVKGGHILAAKIGSGLTCKNNTPDISGLSAKENRARFLTLWLIHNPSSRLIGSGGSEFAEIRHKPFSS